jgi:hypothetical protein
MTHQSEAFFERFKKAMNTTLKCLKHVTARILKYIPAIDRVPKSYEIPRPEPSFPFKNPNILVPGT